MRPVQVACAAPAPFACGALLLTSEVLREQPALWAAALQAEEGDGEERFQDAPLPPDDEEGGEGADDPDTVARRQRAERYTLSARFDLSDSDDEGAGRKKPPQAVDDAAAAPDASAPAAAHPGGGLGRALPGGYDMAKRDPQHAGAERAGLWELPLLAAHMHPSVAAMARSLLAGAHVSYDGDPLRDMALAAFLDRWLQKKPKASKVATDAAARLGRRAAAAQAADKAAPGSAEFTAMLEEDVDPSDVFFHRYFSAVAAKAKADAKARRRHRGQGDGDDGDAERDSDDDDDADEEWVKRRARGAEGEDDEDEFGGDSDSELDAALEAAERDEVGGDGGGDEGHDYADLAAAMRGGSSEDGDPSESESDDPFDGDDAAKRKRKGGGGEGMSVFADAEDFEQELAAGGVERADGGSDPSSDGDDVADYEDDSDDSGRFLAPGGGDSDGGSADEEPAPKAAPKARKAAARPPRNAAPGAGKARRGKRSTGARAVRNPGAEKRKYATAPPAAKQAAPKKARKF